MIPTVLAGLDLYRAGKAPWLLFTGGASPFSPGQPPEGLRYREAAKQLGLADAMASTSPAVNTARKPSRRDACYAKSC